MLPYDHNKQTKTQLQGEKSEKKRMRRSITIFACSPARRLPDCMTPFFLPVTIEPHVDFIHLRRTRGNIWSHASNKASNLWNLQTSSFDDDDDYESMITNLFRLPSRSSPHPCCVGMLHTSRTAWIDSTEKLLAKVADIIIFTQDIRIIIITDLKCRTGMKQRKNEQKQLMTRKKGIWCYL